MESLTSIVEMAVTWDELDYSDCELIKPAEWLAFVDCHEWTDADRVLRFFLAVSSMKP